MFEFLENYFKKNVSKANSQKANISDSLVSIKDPRGGADIIEKTIYPEMRLCPSCNTRTPRALDYCKNCGEDIPE